ncbi:MAG: DUF1697 domain-containing protein [Christensenellaceae bacterium]|jgi:uncharacterized protein (DUF1697 family)|nr:DUF1697 domain-containing protein [Christensenellaceae bacterium]
MPGYIALLRGVNVGGKNKLPMPELRLGFEACGFSAVRSYIASGNLLFCSENEDQAALQGLCEGMIKERFGFPVSVCLLRAEELCAAIGRAPGWWGRDPESKHDALFLLPPLTGAQLLDALGEMRPETERLCILGRVALWSAPLKSYSRAKLPKIVANKALYRLVTVRNRNTALKLAALATEGKEGG